MMAFNDILTPREIHRARDLIQLGILSAEPETNEVLQEVGLAMKCGNVTDSTPKSRERFYNSWGSVRYEWWEESGLTFAEYMRSCE